MDKRLKAIRQKNWKDFRRYWKTKYLSEYKDLQAFGTDLLKGSVNFDVEVPYNASYGESPKGLVFYLPSGIDDDLDVILDKYMVNEKGDKLVTDFREFAKTHFHSIACINLTWYVERVINKVSIGDPKYRDGLLNDLQVLQNLNQEDVLEIKSVIKGRKKFVFNNVEDFKQILKDNRFEALHHSSKLELVCENNDNEIRLSGASYFVNPDSIDNMDVSSLLFSVIMTLEFLKNEALGVNKWINFDDEIIDRLHVITKGSLPQVLQKLSCIEFLHFIEKNKIMVTGDKTNSKYTFVGELLELYGLNSSETKSSKGDVEEEALRKQVYRIVKQFKEDKVLRSFPVSS